MRRQEGMALGNGIVKVQGDVWIDGFGWAGASDECGTRLEGKGLGIAIRGSRGEIWVPEAGVDAEGQGPVGYGLLLGGRTGSGLGSGLRSGLGSGLRSRLTEAKVVATNFTKLAPGHLMEAGAIGTGDRLLHRILPLLFRRVCQRLRIGDGLQFESTF